MLGDPRTNGHRSGAAAPAERLLVVRVEDSEYALHLDGVREILRMVALSELPDAPAWIAGALNLRGVVIPVVDLRARLGLPPVTAGLRTPIVVAEREAGPVGLIADEVVELLTVPATAVSSADGLTAGRTLVTAVARAGDRTLPVISADELLAGARSEEAAA